MSPSNPEPPADLAAAATWYQAPLTPGSRTPLALLVVQPTTFCNIDCSYCYLPNRSTKGRLSFETLELLFGKLRGAGLLPDYLTVAWHAGEPLVLPPDYYAEAFARIERLTAGRCRITHSFQTNATLITQDYCDLFRAHGAQIGLSLDGPEFLHDARRRTRSGSGTFAKAMSAVDLLRKNELLYSAIAVLTDASLDHPDEIYDFFKAIAVTEVGLNLEEVEGVNRSSSLMSAANEGRYKAFMQHLLKRMMTDNNPLNIREFRNSVAQIVGSAFGRQSMSMEAMPLAIISCGQDGDICTFSPELVDNVDAQGHDFSLGNIRDIEFDAIFDNPRFRRLNGDIQSGVAACKQTCSYFNVCGGGAPANKLAENGTFNSTETSFCRYKQKIVADIVEDHLAGALGRSRTQRSAGPAAQVGEARRLPPALAQALRGLGPQTSTPVAAPPVTPNADALGASDTIFLAGAAATPDRIQISPGTINAAALAAAGYEPAALVPRPAWRAPTQQEIDALVAEAPASPGAFVAIVRPPAEIVAPLIEIRDRAASHTQSIEEANRINAKAIEAAAVQLAQLYAELEHPCRLLGVGINAPGLRTVTVNASSGQFLGLHFDSWMRLPPDQRGDAPNRLCVNLGREPRQLLFVNVQMTGVLKTLFAGQPPQNAGATDLGRMFMQRFPDFPVMSLRIDPGEAYIAPTENMIHDGCTANTSTPDIALTLLGRFRRPSP